MNGFKTVALRYFNELTNMDYSDEEVGEFAANHAPELTESNPSKSQIKVEPWR